MSKTEILKALLDARLAAYPKDPAAGSTWAEVEGRIRWVRGFVMVVLLLSLAACGGGGQQPPKAQTLTPADLQKLRWIEGSWRGSGVDQAPFFERYRFENDTTLAVDSFDDEALTKLTETTRFELKNGEFRGGSGNPQYVATALDDNSISFTPSNPGSNSFTWKRDSKDAWTATLTWPASAKRAAGQRIYKMERWPRQ
jgi:hypothetical protein